MTTASWMKMNSSFLQYFSVVDLFCAEGICSEREKVPHQGICSPFRNERAHRISRVVQLQLRHDRRSWYFPVLVLPYALFYLTKSLFCTFS